MLLGAVLQLVQGSRGTGNGDGNHRLPGEAANAMNFELWNFSGIQNFNPGGDDKLVCVAQ